MNLKKQLSLGLLLTCALTIIPVQARHQKDNNGLWGWFALGVGVMAGGCIAKGIYDWATWQDNGQVYAHANNRLQDCKYRFIPILEQFTADSCGATSFHYISEQYALYNLASWMYANTSSSTVYNQYCAAVTDLALQQKYVVERMNYIIKTHFEESGSRAAYDKLASLRSEIDWLLPKLVFMRDCIKYHNAYFNAYRTEAEWANAYNQELGAYKTLRNTNYGALMQELDRLVLMRNSSCMYPHLDYIKSLTKVNREIADALGHAKAYPIRAQNLRTLSLQLAEIRDIIVTSHHYRAQLYAHEQAMIEREKLAILERQAQAQERQAREMAKQTAIAREQAHNNPVHVSVNVAR